MRGLLAALVSCALGLSFVCFALAVALCVLSLTYV